MESLSIHPRNWPNGSGQKRDTSKPHKGGGKLAKKQARLSQRRLAHAATLKTPGMKPEGFKTPGSMNQHQR